MKMTAMMAFALLSAHVACAYEFVEVSTAPFGKVISSTMTKAQITGEVYRDRRNAENYRLNLQSVILDNLYFTGVVDALKMSGVNVPPQMRSDESLGDVKPSTSTNGWGPIEMNASNGEKSLGDGKKMSIAGVQYDKGIGCHAPSTIDYALAGAYAEFTTMIGVDDESGAQGSVTFQIWLDGVMVFDSNLMKFGDAARMVRVSVVNKRLLRLVVTDGGNGAGSDHADWADAKISR